MLVSTSPAGTSPNSQTIAAGFAARDPGREPDQAAALAIVDECAARFQVAVPSVRLTLATEAEREAVYRLRYRAVMARGWADPADFPDGLERDADDERALHAVAWVGAELAGTGRIVLPMPARELPVEAIYDLIVEPRGRVVNVDRLAVAPEFSEQQHRVFLCLLGRAWQETRAAGYCHCAGIVAAAMIRLFRMAGMETQMLGPARDFWHESRYPMLFDGAASAPAMAKRWLGK